MWLAFQLASLAASLWAGATVVDALTHDADEAPAQPSRWPEAVLAVAVLLAVLWFGARRR